MADDGETIGALFFSIIAVFIGVVIISDYSSGVVDQIGWAFISGGAVGVVYCLVALIK